jgi:hypothetical protein
VADPLQDPRLFGVVSTNYSNYFAVGRPNRGSKIAKELLRDSNAYMEIFNLNRDQLSDPDKIKPGQVLRIPRMASR